MRVEGGERGGEGERGKGRGAGREMGEGGHQGGWARGGGRREEGEDRGDGLASDRADAAVPSAVAIAGCFVLRGVSLGVRAIAPVCGRGRVED